MKHRLGLVLVSLAMAASAVAPVAATTRTDLEFPLRGKTLTLAVYKPIGQPVGTIIMSSGDVGWVGTGVSAAEFLSDRGYIVIGINVRQYLSTFRIGKSHLTVEDPPADYRTLVGWLREKGHLAPPVVLSGMSEGAALSVLVAADVRNHAWVDGLMTMGIPATAELAWKWTDFTSWITKSDPNEPSFAPYDFIAGVAPVPLVMIQSKRDEYVPERDYQRCHANARDPKRLVLIDASNHRFTDRRERLQQEYLAALAWFRDTKTQVLLRADRLDVTPTPGSAAVPRTSPAARR